LFVRKNREWGSGDDGEEGGIPLRDPSFIFFLDRIFQDHSIGAGMYRKITFFSVFI